jgi:hypothetical protein
MILQREAHIENWIVCWRRRITQSADEFSERHRVGEAIHGFPMHLAHGIRKRPITIHAAAQWHHA